MKMNKEEAIKIIRNSNIIEIKPTKKNLMEILKWSKSRYNEFKKREVVTNILNDLGAESYLVEYIAGTYSETTGYGTHYTFLKENDQAYLIEKGFIDTVVYKFI